MNTTRKYTQEQDDWLRENLDQYTYPELTKQFNERYGTNVKSVSDHVIKVLKLHKSINRGDIRKGERRCKNILPVGTESWDGQNLYVKISNDVNDCIDRKMPSKHNDRNWKRKDYIVWENNGNKIPDDSDMMLVHLNGDKRDCRIENLYLTTRKVNFMMAKNGWYTDSIEHTLVAIKWCELFYSMKGE